MSFDAAIGSGPFDKDAEGNKQREVFVCTFGILARIVGSDGDLDTKELRIIDNIMRNALKLDDERRAFATKVFNEARRASISNQELLIRYRDALTDRPKMYEWLIDVLVRLSLADEILAEEEKELIDLAQETLSISNETMQMIKSRYISISKSDAAYEQLGLTTEANMEEVRNKYNNLMKSFDAQSLIEQGFASELVELAQSRQAEFSSAFMAIQKENAE